MKTYYVFKHKYGYITDLRSATAADRGGSLRFVFALKAASQFSSAQAALSTLQRHARFADNWVPDVNLVRVEESPRPARRELVTQGDLSLLNTNPVVLFGNNIKKFLGRSNYFTEPTIETAVTFPNQGAALGWLLEQDRIVGGSVSVLPIREFQDESSVTETILA